MACVDDAPLSATDRTHDLVRLLEAVSRVQREYGLAQPPKTCVAVLLDGNTGAASRHDAAFVIAIECRRAGIDERTTGRVLARWAKKIAYSGRAADRAVHAAFKRTPKGEYQYHAPGLLNKVGGKYRQVLGDICREVGCPQNCIPSKALYLGPASETHDRFKQLGWPRWLRRQRHAAAAEIYEAITILERRHRLAPGAKLYLAFSQLEEISGRSRSHMNENLQLLEELDLITDLVVGSGSGNYAKDRKPTQLRRVVPIPRAPRAKRAAITSGAHAEPHIGAAQQRKQKRRKT
jgi:hypothetical protein